RSGFPTTGWGTRWEDTPEVYKRTKSERPHFANCEADRTERKPHDPPGRRFPQKQQGGRPLLPLKCTCGRPDLARLRDGVVTRDGRVTLKKRHLRPPGHQLVAGRSTLLCPRRQP